jgi:hypothetical protein
VGVAGEKSLHKKSSHGKMKPSIVLGSRKRQYVCRVFGTNSLKEGAMGCIDPLLGNGSINMFPWIYILGNNLSLGDKQTFPWI